MSPRPQSSVSTLAPSKNAGSGIDPIDLAVGLLGGTVVYLSYFPSDSVAVEKGDALWFGVLAIVISGIVWSTRAWLGRSVTNSHAQDASSDESAWLNSIRIDRWLDFLPWALAAWMMWAALHSSPPGNLRMATNEAWLWVSAAAIFTASRRLMIRVSVRKAILVLLVVCATGLATHGLHQYFISLPANRAAYREDPEQVLELAGVDAPPGSAERMVFANRLFDGGPTATFALANSLAAVLLVSIVIAGGVLRFHWGQLTPAQRIAWCTVAIGCISCMLAARSRSAILACFVGMTLILFASSRLRNRNRKVVVLGLTGILLVGVAAIFLAVAGNREWFEEAPASLAVRLQYWRSTWQLVLDHPLYGAGPGNFQSLYERYREASTTEQVAEPHNLLFETLASGGFIGLGLLLAAIVACLVAIVARNQASTAVPNPLALSSDTASSSANHPIGEQASDSEDRSADDSDRWLWLGAILSLLLIWLIGWASRHVPDLDASLFVLPVAVIVAWVLAPSIGSLATRDIDSIMSVALIAVLIHLMVSGGWTVPGVVIPIWIGTAMLVRPDNSWASIPRANDDADQSGRTSSAAPLRLAMAAGFHLLVLGALFYVSLRPVENRQRLMSTALMARTTGQLGKARISIEQACKADSWSPDAMLWQADTYCWKLILEGDSNDVRRQWESSLAEAKRRAGEDPAVYRVVGAQQLHLYQRHGDARDLDAAAETFGKAVQWSPANQWMMAQMAVVSAALGEESEAKKMASRAAELAELGGNIERALTRQLVYVARPVGRLADRGPLRKPATELLEDVRNPDPAASQPEE